MLRFIGLIAVIFLIWMVVTQPNGDVVTSIIDFWREVTG